MAIPKIIIVEDEMIIAQDIKQVLLNMGYDVPAITGSGEDALRKIEALRPDLVLMDIKLKGDMNGIEAAGQAHALYNIPVVYMTANADEKTVERAKKTEPYGFVYKPVQTNVLRAIIEMALYKHGMEKKLVEREARLKATLNSIGDAVISTDAKGRIIAMNPVAEKLTGWEFNDAEGKLLTEVFNIVNAVTGKKAVNPVRKVLKNGMIVGLANHTMLIAKSGTEYQIADSGSPIHDVTGNIIGVVLVFRDVTEEYRSRQIQRLLASIVESSFDAIIGKLLDGTIVSWNEAAERMFGYTAQEMVGQSILKMVPSDLTEEVLQWLKKIQQGKQVETLDTIRKRKDGSFIHVALTISPIRDENGKICGASTIARDITERTQAEERINHLTLIISSARDVNQLITKEDNRDVLLKETCNILTKNKGYSNALIALFDENHKFNFAAESGIGENFQVLINDLKKDKLPFCIKNALNQKEIFLIDSPEIECTDCPIPVGNEGGSAVSVRLEYNRKIYGVLCAKAEKNFLLDEEILELFKEVAGDIAYALYRLELEEAHKKAEATILENEQFLSGLFESIQDGISVLNPDLTIRHVNSLMNKWYKQNFPLEGKKCYEVYHNADKPCDPCPSLRCFKSGKTENNIVQGLPGSPVEWIELFSYPLRDRKTKEITGVIEFVRDITKRKKIEIVLSEAYKIINRSPTVTFLWKNQEGWPVEFVSENVKKLTGYSSQEFIKENILYGDIIYKDDLERVTEEVDNYSKNEGLLTFSHKPYRIITKNGDIKWVSDETFIRRNASGITTHYEGVVHDITELKRGEEQIRFLSSVVEQSADGMAIADLEGNLLFINDSWVSMHGYSKADVLLGQNLSISHNEEQLKNDVEPFNKEVKEKGHNTGEVGHIRKDGSIFPTLMATTLLMDEYGNPFAIAGVATDITERTQAEEALRESEEKYHAVFEATGTATLIVDEDTAIIDANKECEHITGYATSELIGKSWTKFVYKNDLATMLTRHKARRKNPESIPKKYEVRLINAKGEIRNTILSIEMIPGSKRSIVSMIDITERTQAEEALKRIKDELEKVLDSEPAMVCYKNTEGRIVRVNKRLADALGKTKDELVGKLLKEVHPHFSKKMKKDDDEVIRSGQPKLDIIENYDSPKGRRWSHTDKIPFKNNDGNTIGVMTFALDITERKQAEEALRESEERLKKLSNLTFEGILIHNKGVVIDVNQSLTSMFGYAREEVIGKNVIELCIPKEYHAIVEENIIKSSAKPYEVIARKKDGTLFPIELESRDTKNKDEEFRVTAVRDITERKKAEGRIKESEEKLRNFVDFTPQGIWCFQPEKPVGINIPEDQMIAEFFTSTCIECNDTYANMMGVSKEEILGLKLSDAMPDTDENRNYLRAFIKNGFKLEEGISRELTKDGKEKYFLNSMVGVIKNGKLINAWGTQTDVTESRLVEQALRESEELYRAVVKNSHDGILIVGKNYKFEYVNDKMCRILGCGREEIIGHDFRNFLDEESKKLVADRYLKRRMGEEVPPMYEFNIVRKDGEQRKVEISSAVVKDSHDNVKTIAQILDITERKQAEEQIKRDLKEKEILLKEVHHRVKNNLTVITSLLNLQSSNLSSKEQAVAAFKDTRDRVYTMAMVQEKLYQSGNYSEINMKEYTETLAVKLMQIYSPSTNIIYNFNIEDISIDVNRAIPCGLILNELITNALKHAFKGMSKGEISISFNRLKSGQNEIIVQDNGVGLPPDIEVKKVNSLGLRLIYILTEQLEGKLTISKKNGTKFKILFPK